ncbi:PLD nuclease N-terminal domain-containing protein [Crossiella sp. CA-258035]|uniref:PLD nuclease N-terminal domain-containing protein n=1 Tax=Crossiella sp. CA-258035 TaxID=2981138 RepID=UPI0024BBEDA3|nr:PLD nuclease N-terminal domain-containing protein [Crossiella sp. CA-258035]WHT17478.1 PLD nuclease N-terminal domain-containing protein [Crossiella sp. CA-258035]
MPFVGVFGLLLLALWIFCIIDVIRTPDGETNHLPKMLWLLIVIIIPTVGSIVWLVLGRPQGLLSNDGGARGASPRVANRFPEYNRPGRHVAQNPDDDEAFLRSLRERVEEQRRAAQQKDKKEDDQ